jgi:hypothetical protein
MIALQFSNSEKGAAKGLCLEFILHEFTNALAMTSQMGPSSLEDALNVLQKLFHDSLNASYLPQSGIIDKLCIYCEALVQTSKIGEDLLDALDELRNGVSSYRTALVRRMYLSHSPQLQGMDDLQQTLQRGLRHFFSLLIPVLETCLDCEMVIFTLLELRKKLNGFLGENTVECLFQRLFPDGPHLLRRTLSDGFSRRGFSDFYQRHEVLFEGLAWSNPTELSTRKP